MTQNRRKPKDKVVAFFSPSLSFYERKKPTYNKRFSKMQIHIFLEDVGEEKENTVNKKYIPMKEK